MLTAEGCRNRRKRLYSRLTHQPDAIVISDPRHLVYFGGYDPSPFSFRSYGSSAAMVLRPDGSVTLVSDANARIFAESAFVDEVLLPRWYDGRKSAPPRQQFVWEQLGEWLIAKRLVSLGCESHQLPILVVQKVADECPGVTWMDVSAEIHHMKRRKDADEIALLRSSAQAGEAGFRAAREDIEPGMTELEAYLIVQNACQVAAGRQAVVYGDFVSGERSADGGGQPGGRIIQQADLLLLDFSVVLMQYRLDFATTFACRSQASDRQHEIAQACVRAMEAGEQLLKPGTACKDVDAVVRTSLGRDGLDQYFNSHVGHGLGLGHPDPPYLTSESSDILEQGNVVTLEPGVFFPGEFGIRVERNYLITESSCEILTRHSLDVDGVVASH